MNWLYVLSIHTRLPVIALFAYAYLQLLVVTIHCRHTHNRLSLYVYKTVENDIFKRSTDTQTCIIKHSHILVLHQFDGVVAIRTEYTMKLIRRIDKTVWQFAIMSELLPFSLFETQQTRLIHFETNRKRYGPSQKKTLPLHMAFSFPTFDVLTNNWLLPQKKKSPPR